MQMVSSAGGRLTLEQVYGPNLLVILLRGAAGAAEVVALKLVLGRVQ